MNGKIVENRIMKPNRNVIDVKLFKFLIVGFVNTLVGTGIMLLLYNLAGCNYWLSSAVNYVIGSILSYFLNKYFTFQNKTHSWKIVVRFIVNIVLCYIVAYGTAKPITLYLLRGEPKKIQENVAMLVGMVLFTSLNYIGQRFFAFKTGSSNRYCP